MCETSSGHRNQSARAKIKMMWMDLPTPVMSFRCLYDLYVFWRQWFINKYITSYNNYYMWLEICGAENNFDMYCYHPCIVLVSHG